MDWHSWFVDDSLDLFVLFAWGSGFAFIVSLSRFLKLSFAYIISLSRFLKLLFALAWRSEA